MLSITRVQHSDFPSITFEDIKLSIKRTWLKALILSDRMTVAKVYPDLYHHGHQLEAQRIVKIIGKSHAAKSRLLRRLYN